MTNIAVQENRTQAIDVIAPSSQVSGARNIAVDAYRGLVMVLMMAEVLHLARVAQAFPGNRFWAFLAYNQTHVEWSGCSLHDLIQPSFSFLVGVALPYSIASRLAKGASFERLFLRALWPIADSGSARNLSPFDAQLPNLLHIRRHTDTNRTGVSIPVSSWLPLAAPAMDGILADSVRILARLGVVPGAWRQLLHTGRACELDAQLYRLRRSLEQEQQFRNRLRSVVFELVPARQSIYCK